MSYKYYSSCIEGTVSSYEHKKLCCMWKDSIVNMVLHQSFLVMSYYPFHLGLDSLSGTYKIRRSEQNSKYSDIKFYQYTKMMQVFHVTVETNFSCERSSVSLTSWIMADVSLCWLVGYNPLLLFFSSHASNNNKSKLTCDHIKTAIQSNHL